jgi:ribosomal protein S11
LGDTDLALSVAKNATGVLDVQMPTPAAAPSAVIAAPTVAPLNILKEVHVAFTGDYNDASNLLRALMHTGVQVVSFSEESDSLETLFMKLTG